MSDPVYRDHLLQHRARGRGAQLNPGNRFEGVRLHVLGDVLDEQVRDHPSGVQVKTRILADSTRSIINHVDSPDLGFSWTINPYRGCEHGCIYCYARPTHENLGLSCGLDFETTIMAKTEAPDLLLRELASPKWSGEPIVMSGVTDPYQPAERDLKITRRCLEIMRDCRQPVGLITKNHLVMRDIDLLSAMAKERVANVAISMTTLDPHVARVMEPRASTPRDRLRAIRELTDAGVPVVAMLAPIVPGLNDREIPAILDAVKEAGARSAGWIMLRLPHQIKALFLNWLTMNFPDRAKKVEQFIRDMRGGDLYDARWKKRQRGEGVFAEQIKTTFDVFAKRHGLDGGFPKLRSDRFRRPNLDGQMGLFEE